MPYRPHEITHPDRAISPPTQEEPGLGTFRVTAKPSRISSHQLASRCWRSSPSALPGAGELCPTDCGPISFHQHPKNLLWDKSHQTLPFAFPSPNKLLQARDIFSSPLFPKGHCEVLYKQRNEARQFETEEKISQPSQQHQQFRENTWSCQYPVLSGERFGTYSSLE